VHATSAPATTAPAVTIDARYRLDALIGRGGMAEVWRGHDLVLERPVAVKILRDGGDHGGRRFAAEVRALARLSHPGIVRLFDGGTWQGRPFLVMELVEGGCLADRLARGPLEQDQARRLGIALAAALAHAHARDLVHRDVKPGNVLISASGDPRLGDFGIARIADETLSATAAGLGTAAYLAPEQLLGEEVGPAADVYALGLILLECLTARREFRGSATEAALARLGRDPTIPEHLAPGWASLLRRMTAREPADRPTAAAVEVALAAGALDATQQLAVVAAARTRLPAPSRRAAAGVLAGIAVALMLSGAGGEVQADEPVPVVQAVYAPSPKPASLVGMTATPPDPAPLPPPVRRMDLEPPASPPTGYSGSEAAGGNDGGGRPPHAASAGGKPGPPDHARAVGRGR
jgi:eukaryotic-like serine/threonine-protein kinase